MRKDLKPETSKPQGSKRSGMLAGKLFYPGFLPADRQCVRVLGKGKAPAEEAHKAVVKPLAAGVLAGHEVIEGQVNLVSGDGRAIHFSVQHGVVKQGREQHVRRGGSPGDAVPAVAGRDGECTALRFQADGGVIHADGGPVAEVRLLSLIHI